MLVTVLSVVHTGNGSNILSFQSGIGVVDFRTGLGSDNFEHEIVQTIRAVPEPAILWQTHILLILGIVASYRSADAKTDHRIEMISRTKRMNASRDALLARDSATCCAHCTLLRSRLSLLVGRVILTFSCPAVCASVIRFVAAKTCVARVLPLLLLGQVDSRENGFRLWLLTMEVSSPMRDGFMA